MSSAVLLNVPRSPAEWQIFGFTHAVVHRSIRQALAAKGVAVSDYILDPINFNYLDDWLSNVQQTHNEMNSALGLQSNDLQGADLRDPNQAQAWIYLNWQEDYAAMNALGL